MWRQMSELERELRLISRNASRAVVPIMAWSRDFPKGGAGVIGTAFFINEKGYFFTANHVFDSFPSDKFTFSLSIHDFESGGRATTSLHFECIERNSDYDLALCRSEQFEHLWKIRNGVEGGSGPPELMRFDLDTLSFKVDKPIQGSFAVVIGFPLSSWNSTVLLGTVAATQTVNPNAPRTPAGQTALLQIAVPANKGNSGSPVIEMESKKVIGIIIKVLPALLLVEGAAPAVLNSGIALAAPAEWAIEILRKHGLMPEN